MIQRFASMHYSPVQSENHEVEDKVSEELKKYII